MQGALGELSYESEAAEQLRGELRAAAAAQGALRTQLDAATARAALEQHVGLPGRRLTNIHCHRSAFLCDR